jgi:hypothetical protein
MFHGHVTRQPFRKTAFVIAEPAARRIPASTFDTLLNLFVGGILTELSKTVTRRQNDLLSDCDTRWNAQTYGAYLIPARVFIDTRRDKISNNDFPVEHSGIGSTHDAVRFLID